jgi:molybdopterin-guanine dinucleotide biosynthesis protein A
MDRRARAESAIVLAGGRSSRMGRPKALLPFDGVPLIVHVVSAMKALFGEVVVVAAPDQDLPTMPVILVRDEVAYQGPVGGICYGLKAAAGEMAFVTSCDSVFPNPGFISHLLSQADGYDVVVPYWQGRLQPLHAVYRKSVVTPLEKQLERAELRPVYLFDKVRTRRLEEDEIRRFDPVGLTFFNMNTPEDYTEALRRWREIHGSGDRENEGPVRCTVELFGVARMLAHTREVSLELPAGATFAEVFDGLAERLPALVGRVIAPDRTRLLDGYACNVNGLEFVRSPAARVHAGDSVVILAADAGG